MFGRKSYDSRFDKSNVSVATAKVRFLLSFECQTMTARTSNSYNGISTASQDATIGKARRRSLPGDLHRRIFQEEFLRIAKASFPEAEVQCKEPPFNPPGSSVVAWLVEEGFSVLERADHDCASRSHFGNARHNACEQTAYAFLRVDLLHVR